MNILGALKKKHEKQIRQQLHMPGERKQLNTVVNTKIIHKVRRLAAEFAVPQYAIAEHLLETGHFYISRIMKKRKEREILREHLIDKHILDSGDDDPEELLRIGEGNYASALISLAKVVVRDFRVLERVWADAKKNIKTANLDNVERARKKFLNSALNLAYWLSKHPLEEPDKEEMEDDWENSRGV